jgi:NADPH:quinone reductase
MSVSTMKVVRIREPGGPEVLELAERPMPVPQASEVRVRVQAVGVNRADLLQRAGFYPPPSPGIPVDIPGLEYVGTIDAVGAGVGGKGQGGFDLGERVYGIVAGGGYAEYLVVHALATARVPQSIPGPEAAALPEAYLTAYDALLTIASLAPGETVLIHAVGSGVGTAALALALAVGARPIGTARSAEKLVSAEKMGLKQSICVKDARFSARVLEMTEGRGAAVILDLVGGAYAAENLHAVQSRGRIVSVGLVAGRTAELDLGLLLRKRATLFGTVLRSRGLGERIELHRILQEHLGPLFEAGRLTAVVDRAWPLSEASEAHRYLESNESFGKVILRT